jgi:O-antigen/teichoic acid export membrane protein
MKSGAGLVSMLSILVFTRLMHPDEYGIYAMLLSGLGICHAIIFQWLSQGLGRFYAHEQTRTNELLSTVVCAYILAIVFGTLLLVVAMLCVADAPWKKWILYLPPLVFSYAWFELNLRIANASMQPKLYGYISFSKAILGFFVGAALYQNIGLHGVFLGLILSAIVTPHFWMRTSWKDVDAKSIDKAIFNRFLVYGLPLALTVTLTLVVDVSDRFIIGSMLGAKQAGLYSASYDLVVQTMGFVTAALYLAAFPLLVQDIETKNAGKIASRLGQYSTLLLATSVPLLIVFLALPSNVSSVVFGLPFRESATQLIPTIALGVFVGGIKIHFFDVVFQLGQKTLQQIWPALLTAFVNVILNILWIPTNGISGAAYATFAAFLCGCFASAVMARRILPMTFPGADMLKILLSGICMYLLLLSMKSYGGWIALVFQILSSMVLYLALILALNVAEVRRSLLVHWLRKNDKY